MLLFFSLTKNSGNALQPPYPVVYRTVCSCGVGSEDEEEEAGEGVGGGGSCLGVLFGTYAYFDPFAWPFEFHMFDSVIIR